MARIKVLPHAELCPQGAEFEAPAGGTGDDVDPVVPQLQRLENFVGHLDLFG